MAGDRIDKLYNALKADGTSVPSRDIFRRNMLAPGKTGYNNRLQFFKAMKADGADVGNTYEDFAKSLGLHAVGTPTVNKYRKQLFDSVDPNKSRASELTHRAVNTAKRAMNNVRKPVTAKYVNKEGKPTGEEFAVTPAKTVEDLDREYAQEVTKNWENELHDQMADADKDAAKISDMFKSFIGSTDEVGSVWGNMTRGGGIAGTPHSVTTNNGILENTEARQLLAASDYNRKRKELLQLEQDSRNGAFFDDHSFFRGMYDAAKDTGLLTGGASDLINAGSLLSTKQDFDNGVHTEAGDMLMQQAVKNSDAQGQYGDNKGWMYTGGVITTNMAPFMVQIASAGFSKGMSNAIGKVVQGAASKVALGTMKKAAGFASADLAKNIGKFTGLTTKAFGKAIQYGIVGAAQANTVGLGNVANDVMNRYTGQVYQDEQGNYKFGTFDSDGNLVHEGGEDFLTALAKGEVAQTIEFATELAGGGIDAVGTALKNFVTKGGKKIVEKYSMENVSKVIDFLLNNKVSKNVRYLKAGADRTLGKVELNSVVGESLEEELGIIANTVFTGDNKISDLWDEKQQSQIWGGMLLSVGLMKGAVAPFHAYNAKQYYSYKHKLNKADANLSQLLGNEKWEELRNQIDATTNKDMPDMINKVNRDVALGKNRQPVREYIQNLIIMRGYDIGNMLAAKKAVEDKGNGVSVKNMEKNQAYQQGRDAYGYDTHEIQLDQEDKQKSLAQLLGISEQQLSGMSEDELESMTGQDDKLDRAIYDYQLSTARYEGVVDNARDQIDLEVQRAAQAVDMYTDKSRNTIRNATIKATGGLEDYGVYIINGNVATHDDGSIDISNSDDMILYFDPTTNTVEHADAMMFAELGSEENADEVRSQAMADAKEKAIKETTGIIDGVVEVGTQFKTVDTDGIEHTYEVLADNGDGTAMITIDGNVPTELVKGENVNIPVSFEELQKMKDDSDQQRLQAAKAQREQMEKERAEQETQVQTTQAQDSAQDSSTQPAPIEDNLDYSDIIREDGKVQMVDVSDKDGNNLFPEAKDVFYIQGNKIRTKFAYIDANGELKTQRFPTRLLKIKTRGEVSVDDYKKYRNTILAAESQAMPESSMIEDNSGVDRGGIEVESPTIEGETAAPESAETPVTEQTPATPAMTLEDGTIVPMLEDGNPDFSKLTAEQTAELYDTQFGEDADGVIGNWVSEAKKALDKANNMAVKGKTFVEQKAAKDAKEKAIADAQAAYDSAIAIRDAYNNRQLAKAEGTPEGRRSLVDKARRKFARLKSSVKDDAEEVARLYRDTVGSILHSLYDGTGIDVTDTVPLTAEEYVASNLGAHSLNYEGNETSKGVKQETGLSREDFAKTQLLAADGKGTTIDALVHSLWDNRPSNLESLDTQDIRNALIDVLTSGFKASEARSYIENIRIAQAEKLLEEQELAAENAAYAEQQKAKEEEEKKKAEEEDEETSPLEGRITETNEESEVDGEYGITYNKVYLIDGDKRVTKVDEPDEKGDYTGSYYMYDGKRFGDLSEVADYIDGNNSDNINEKTNENTNFPDKLKEGNETIEVPEDATDENPLGLQLSEDKVPFEIKGEKSGDTYDINDKEDRQRLVAENSVDDKDILDIDMPEHVHKAIKELCKKMGLKVQFLYMGARSNGWIENGTMYLALDTEKATQFVFGHEMTHAIKQKNPEAYKELVKVAMAVTTKKEFEEDLSKVYQNYHGISGYNNVDDYVEEVVADNLGKFINNFDLARKFSLRLNHPVLATILHAIQKIKGLLYGDFYKSVDALERIVEQAYVKTAKGEVTNSETGEDVSFSLRLKSAIEETETNPSDAQKESGNYKKGHIKFGGYDYTIENPKGSTRSGKDANGKEWKVTMHDTYGYIRGKFGKDGDHLDMFINDKADLDNWDGDVFVVDQVNPDGSFDEHKVMYGYDTMDDAEKAYLANYSKGWQGLGNITGVSKDEFDKWLDTSNRKLKPFADYAKVKFSQAQSVAEPRFSLDDIKPVSVGDFGNIYNQFRGKAKAAIEFLKKLGSGEATAALHHHTIGDISLVWGDKKTGLDKILRKHPEVVDNLQSIIDSMEVVRESDNRIKLESPTHFAVVSKEYKGEPREQWLLTAYEKRESLENGKSMDTATSSLGGDTALSQSKGSAAKIDNSSETSKENGEKVENEGTKFSLKDEKTMFGMHNISVDKLRKAIKQGGFAAPSMGVVDSKNGIYSGYGEITLIPKAEKIAKRTGKNIGTYAADAWTPIYPPVEKKFGGNGSDVAYNDIESVPKEMQRLTRNAINSFMDGREANGLAYLYLQEKGKTPELVHVEGKYPKKLHDEVKSILGKLDGIYSTTDEQKEELLDLFIREVYDGNREEFDNDIKKIIKKDEEFIKKRPNSNIAKNKQLDVVWMKEHGYDYGALSRFVDGILRDAETSGKVDENATMKAAQQYIQDNSMKEDFDSWKEKLNDRYNVEEVIFAGYKPDGNRKYLPNTVENAVKVMKQDGKNASVGSASFSHFVASILKPMGTLDQIRKKKGNLTGNYEDVEKFQEKWQPVYDELADKMQPDAEPFESYGMDRLEEAATQKNPKKYAKDEYGVDLTDEDIDKLNELIDAVKNEKPSIYFETKFMRPYGLDEFEKAIVPNDTPSDVVDALKMAGIDVSIYERGNAEDRQKVTMDAINSSDNIRFSLKSMMAKPEGWKQANKKTIHIAEAIERDPKFSLKKLDGTLIKAGTYFSGGGLVEEGLKGIIDPVVAVEYDEKISGVYRNNFGQHIVTADVRDVDPKELVKQIDGEVEYFHASPVCKNYSQAKSNHAEVELDKETAASTADFINAVKPKVVTIENVKGYKDSDAMKAITDALDANGYTWDADVYNAADYGGYTNRERLIVRAVRDGKLPAKPKKMAHKSGWYEAVADIIPTLTEKKNGVAPWMDVRLKADGIDWRNIDKPLYVMGSAYADGKVPHAFADELLPTLRTKSGDVIVMPDGKVYRAMGRVLARVSGVSDDYKMPFSENLSHTIIGNGIPTQLTEHVIAPLLQNTLRPTTPEDGNTKFSLRGSTPYDKQMEEWMEKNHLEKGAVPMEKPIMKEGENIFDYANRMVEWTRNQNLWKTAPKQTGFQDALEKWKADNGLSPDAYPPVRPHRENYSTEIGYAEDLEEYNKKKELWKSAPKPKDFDLSVDLEDMNKQLRNIRRAVLNQKNYDQRTVKAVSDLVRKMLNIGWGDGLSRGKVGNLLSAAKNATGANDVKKYLDKAMGILAENYLNRLSTAYDNLINTKGARADQSGVIKIGSLDAKGQAFMSEYKKAINMDDSSLNTYIANIEEDSAKNEDNVEMNDYRLAGIQAAIMYKQQIGGNDADIAELQRQIGELKNKKDATKEDKDLLKSLEKKLFENKFDRITMYENLLNNIQRMVKESKGRAKKFREEIAEHKNEILHRANLDLEGMDSAYYDTTTAKKKFVNNVFQRAAFSSTYTFEQFLKFFGKHSANGEGYLYNYFTKQNQDALDEEQLYNEMNRNALDEKTKELFGKEKFMKLVGIDGKGMKEMDIEVTDYSNKKTGKRTIHLKQGQMLYIYLVNKETDGEMKLRAMGITEEVVAAIEENLDPRVKAMGEWLQDEYLPECQRRYQATHTKYFCAPMKEVENYFPLAINNRARNVKEDVNQDSDAMSQLAGTSTGAIVTRRVNVIPLDIENADAFEVAFNHLQEMEEWSAMLPFRQDVNTLLSYTHFRNQVQNMSSVAYGSGKTLWDEFKQTAQIAAGTYKSKVNAGMMDSRIAAAMGGIAVAKISGRLWTAIKQSQSATVFLPECDFTRFVKNGVNPYGSWKWAMENIPDFRKRVENMTYGDVKLRQYLDELEKWHDWTKTISKIGMAPNILVDGITCAVGARSVYETEVNRLTKLGYPKEKAEEKAYYKAVAAYNKTQQSSGGMYLSPMQVNRTYASAALSLFKNANYAYGRMQIEACRGLARTYDFWGGKHKTALIGSMTRQIMKEDGLDENTARAIAKATYNRTFRQSIGRLINFATLVPVSWALYKVLPYLLTGDDDDKKKDMIEEAVLKGFATSLSDNYVIPFASNILNAGLKVEDGKPTFDPEVFRYQNLYINPATSDLANIYSMIGNQKWYSVVNKFGMLGVQSLIGFNPETVGALYQAFAEADYDNGNTAKEWQIGILKAISAPEESIRELYMDELGLKNENIKKIPLAELEKRYAERQINRDNLLSQIGMDAETFNGYVDKYQQSFEKKIKDKMDKWDEYDKKKVDEFFDTTSDPKLKDMIAKKRAKDANAAADEQIAKEGLDQEKKGKEPYETAYDAVKMSIDVAEDNAISTYNKVLNKRYAALNDEYNNQTDAMKYIFMSKHPNFKSYKDLKSEYTTYGKKMKELKEKLVSADGYDAKQTILKQIRTEREKFSELQSKVR